MFLIMRIENGKTPLTKQLVGEGAFWLVLTANRTRAILYTIHEGGDRYVCNFYPARSNLPFTLHGLTQRPFIVNAEIQHASERRGMLFCCDERK